jgi:hypothetical protein
MVMSESLLNLMMWTIQQLFLPFVVHDHLTASRVVAHREFSPDYELLHV